MLLCNFVGSGLSPMGRKHTVLGSADTASRGRRSWRERLEQTSSRRLALQAPRNCLHNPILMRTSSSTRSAISVDLINSKAHLRGAALWQWNITRPELAVTSSGHGLAVTVATQMVGRVPPAPLALCRHPSPARQTSIALHRRKPKRPGRMCA